MPITGAFSVFGIKGQPGSVVLNISTYHAVIPRSCPLYRRFTTPCRSQALLYGVCAQGEAHDFTFAALATDPTADVRVKADVLNATATADVRIFCGPGFGRVGAADTASAVLPTPQDALWKTGAATSQGARPL